MKQLIMKDIRLLGIMNLIIVAIGVFGGFFGIYVDEVYKSNYVYVFIIIIILFLVNNVLITKESRSNSDTLMISLPVKKFDIVKSRYISIIIYIFGALAIMYLTSNIVKMSFYDMMGSPLELLEILIISSVILIFLSFYIPFQYYDQKNAQIFSAVLYLIAINIPNIMKRFSIDLKNSSFIKKVLTMDFGIIGLIFIVFSFILFLISSFISKAIYEAKEF